MSELGWSSFQDLNQRVMELAALPPEVHAHEQRLSLAETLLEQLQDRLLAMEERELDRKPKLPKDAAL